MKIVHMLAAALGYAVVLLALKGSFMPGSNFHLFSGPDAEALDFHKQAIEKIEARQRTKE